MESFHHTTLTQTLVAGLYLRDRVTSHTGKAQSTVTALSCWWFEHLVQVPPRHLPGPAMLDGVYVSLSGLGLLPNIPGGAGGGRGKGGQGLLCLVCCTRGPDAAH